MTSYKQSSHSHSYPRIICQRYAIAFRGIRNHAEHFAATTIQRNVLDSLERKHLAAIIVQKMGRGYSCMKTHGVREHLENARAHTEQVRLREAEQHSRHWEMLGKLRTLRERIHANKSSVHDTDDDVCQFMSMIMICLGQRLIVSCQKQRTSMSRDDTNQAYGSMHQSWLWYTICETYFAGARDPMSKSDELMCVMCEVRQLLHEHRYEKHVGKSQ